MVVPNLTWFGKLYRVLVHFGVGNEIGRFCMRAAHILGEEEWLVGFGIRYAFRTH